MNNKLDMEKVKKYLSQFYIENSGNKEFYIALLIYDRLGIGIDEVTEEIIEQVGNLYDGYDTIYNNHLNEALSELEEEMY